MSIMDDVQFMKKALEAARKCEPEDDRVHPHVGVVVVKDGNELAVAYRGDSAPGDHAEYVALEKKLCDVTLAGSTVYTTLEPCTTRKHPKVSCAERLIERKVARVVIGMLDPNPLISGKGQRRLREANIVTDLFPSELMAEVEEQNREFARYQKRQDEGHIVKALAWWLALCLSHLTRRPSATYL
jgi:pyrimidine deaminase RibD-like protein